MPTTHMEHCKRPHFTTFTILKVFTTVPGEKIWFQGVKITILSYKNPIFVKARSFNAFFLPIFIVSHCGSRKQILFYIHRCSVGNEKVFRR